MGPRNINFMAEQITVGNSFNAKGEEFMVAFHLLL